MDKPQETQSYDSSSNYSKADKFGYKGWMNSDKFIKRSFGVFGYNMFAGCLIQAVLTAIFVFFAAIFGGFGALMNNL
jgi:hypothetical protein